MPVQPGLAGLAGVLGPVLVIYCVAMFALGWWTQRKIHTSEDFIVAGRRLPLMLASATLLATWFGAGALLTSTEVIRKDGLRMAALDPIGAGLCLLLAGWLIAGPLWRMKLLTLSDFFRERYGPRAERWSAYLMVPTYFGWIAAQFVALAALLELVFGIDPLWGIAIVAVVGTAYTLLGGMWSVTLTDAVQLVILAIGLAVVSIDVLAEAGGIGALFDKTPPEHLVLVPTDNAEELVGWLGVVAIGALGNLPGQDLTQRVFASKSERTAVWACHLSGIFYMVLGLCPMLLGLAANVLAPETEGQATLPALAGLFADPIVAVIFVLALVSAVLSTVDSAILSPASVIAHNLLEPRIGHRFSALTLDRFSVLFVAVAAMITAYVGEDAYEMLESAYELGLVSLLVPLLAGIRTRHGREPACLAAMALGTVVWLVHMLLGWETFLGPAMPFPLPVGLTAAALAAVAFAINR
jgi:SSS family solute:Na+ symporter